MAIVRIPVEIRNATFKSTCINVFHARVETAGDLVGGGVEPFNGPLGALRKFYTSLKDLYPTGTTIRIPHVVVDVESQEELAGDAAADIVPAWNAAQAPHGLAVVCSWHTSIRARRGRGRSFLGPFIMEQLEGNGTPTAATITQVQAAANTLIADSTAVNGWALGVYGQESNSIPNPKVLRDFTLATVADKWGHVRSRRD